MIMHYSRISLVRKKKELAGVQALNRPPRLKGMVAKPKYKAPENWDLIIFETTTTGTQEEVMKNPYYIGVGFRYKGLPGKKTDYEMVKVEHLRECGVTAYDDPRNKVVTEVLRPWTIEKYVHKEEVKPVVVEKPKFSFPPIKLGK